MEKYMDMEILREREERKKEKYKSLEEGYYIAGQVVRFSRKKVMERFYMFLPDCMKIMPEQMARIKYPSEFRPQEILTTADLSVNLGFTVFSKQFGAEEMEELAKRMRSAIKRDHPDYAFDECIKIEESGGYCFSFRSHAMDSDIYNGMLAVQMDRYAVLANFNCPYTEREQWEEPVMLMWKTMEPLERKGDVER
ncbi:MAG TPA: hypothetical protein DCZ40_05805 [Lachnospiraceae bacterium]|nr:hypothetical protein [Lachnospiraceae bacterium]